MRNACLALLLVALFPCSAWPQNLNYLNGNRPLVDAHNCYPDDGQWSDRIDRALSAGFPVGMALSTLVLHGAGLAAALGLQRLQRPALVRLLGLGAAAGGVILAVAA